MNMNKHMNGNKNITFSNVVEGINKTVNNAYDFYKMTNILKTLTSQSS